MPTPEAALAAGTLQAHRGAALSGALERPGFLSLYNALFPDGDCDVHLPVQGCPGQTPA